MTLQQCYEMMNANFDEVKQRLMKEQRIEKIMLLFLKDPSYELLKTAMESGDRETAFRAAHTLKGISLNLSLTPLQHSSSALSEALRRDPPAENARELYEALIPDYERTAAAIRQYQSEMEK